MSYAQAAKRANPAAMLGALGVPAAFGAVLIVGLAVTVVDRGTVFNPEVIDIPIDPPEVPPPPPKPQPEQQEAQTTKPQETLTYVRPPRDDFTFNQGPTTPTETLPSFGTGPVGPVDLPGIPDPVPSPRKMFDPVKAAPRGNPGRWVTDNDYRSNWIRQELSGSASFVVAIDASGKVTNCSITRSTGHSELDNATCALVTKRAKFDPAKDENGKSVPGTYANTVNWQIPE